MTFINRNRRSCVINRKLEMLFVFVILSILFITLGFRYNMHSKDEQINYSDIRQTEHAEVNFNRITLIKEACGELCNTSRKGTNGPFFDHINTTVNCNALFKHDYFDQSHEHLHAPKEIPTELLSDFTMGYRIPVRYTYYDQPYLGNKALVPVWTNELIEEWISLANRGILPGNYGIKETNALRDGLLHAPGIKHGRILVIVSENPWVESCCLEAGAREVVTLEYGRIISLHLKVKTITPSEFRHLYLNNSLGIFDAVVTFSSVEHSGLGRYGDALNPWGDLIAIARGWCVTKYGGSLTIGVTYNHDNEYIEFNAHRWYGKIRYPYLSTNWRQHYRGSGYQRVHVFTK